MSTLPKNYTIHCFVPGKIETVEIPYPSFNEDEVIIKSIYTGICRTDVDIFEGKAKPLPFGMFGHEGFGIIVDAPIHYQNWIGKYAASRADMAYAKYYKSSVNDLKVLWSLKEKSPAYILEPLACAVNIAEHVDMMSYHNLILGTGFLARSVQFYLENRIKMRPEMVYNNYEVSDALNVDDVEWDKYETIIDCSGRIPIPLDKIYERTHLIMASSLQYPFCTNFSDYLWKAVKMDFPSPRSEKFSMNVSVPSFARQYWTHTDKFENAQTLFEVSTNRDKDFKRSYISYE